MPQFVYHIAANRYGALALLSLAALLEVLADSYFNSGLHRFFGWNRVLPILAGVGLLTLYGLLLNLPRWDFGRLLGVYVALFFVMAQVVARVRFGETPGRGVLLGGCLIVVGGMVVAFWRG